MSGWVCWSVASYKATSSNWSAFDFVTRTPCCWTGCGNRDCTALTWFWTWTCAVSGLVPLAKITEMLACPRDDDVDEK